MKHDTKHWTAARAILNYIFIPYLRLGWALVPQLMRLSFISRPIKKMFKNVDRAEAVEFGMPFAFYLIVSVWISSAVSSSEATYPKYMLANLARVEMTKGRSSAETATSNQIFTDGALCGQMEYLQRPYEFLVGPDHLLTFYGPGDSTITHTDMPVVEGSFRDSHKTIKVCTSIVAGSTTGPFSSWRRGPGMVVSWIAFTAPPLGTVVAAALILVPMVLLFALCFSFCWVLPAALFRGVTVMIRTARLPRAKRWIPRPLGTTPPLVLMLSDTHLCETGVPKEITVEPVLWPVTHGRLDTSKRLDNILAAVAKDISVPIVIAGDITDLGRSDEWMTARLLIGKHRLSDRAILIPGNHDLSINDEDDPDLDGTYRAERLTRYMRSAAMPPSVTPARGDAEWPKTLLLGSGGSAVRLIFLDSNHYYSRGLGSNAIGSLGRRQMDALRASLDNASEPCLVFLHHHICDFGDDGGSGLARAAQNLLMMLADGREFVDILRAYTARSEKPVLVAHGHRHMQANYELDGKIHVHAHPSSTMGIEDGHSLDGIMRYTRIGFSGEFLLEVVEVTPEAHGRAAADRPGPRASPPATPPSP